MVITDAVLAIGFLFQAHTVLTIEARNAMAVALTCGVACGLAGTGIVARTGANGTAVVTFAQ